MANGTIDANMRDRYNERSTSTDDAPVNLKSFTSSATAYVFPHDGYIKISSEGATSGYCRVVVTSKSGRVAPYMYMNITGKFQIQSMFVRAGMKAYVQDVSSPAEACTVMYYPLTMYS